MKKLLFLLLLVSCSPSTMQDFQHEGEARCRALVRVLEKIQSSEELHRAEPELKKYFSSLVDLMIEAKRFQMNLSDPELIEEVAHQASVDLKQELRRIYAMEGGREVIEKGQHEALVWLDSALQKLNK